MIQIKGTDQQYRPPFDIKVQVMKKAHVIKNEHKRQGPRLVHETHSLEQNDDPSIIMKTDHNDVGNPNTERYNKVAEKFLPNAIVPSIA